MISMLFMTLRLNSKLYSHIIAKFILNSSDIAMISGEVKPRVPASQTRLVAAAVAPPESVKIATVRLGARKKLGLRFRLGCADAMDISTRMATESAGPSSMVVTSATSTQGTAVMLSGQQELGCGGLSRLATLHHQQTTSCQFSNPDPENRKLSASPPPWCRRSPAEPASPAATTGRTPSARWSSGSAMEVGSPQRVSPPSPDPDKSFQTILSKNQLHYKMVDYGFKAKKLCKN